MPASRSPCWPGVHSGCYELFAHERDPHHQRPEGQECRHARTSSSAAHLLPGDHGRARRARSRRATSTGSRVRRSSRWSCSPKARSTLSSAFPPEPQELRARNIGRVIVNTRRWTSPGRSTSAACWYGSSGVRPRSSGRHQARAARHPQGRRPLRRRAGAGRATSGRWRVHRALRVRAPDADRDPVRQLARVTTPRTRMRFYALRLHEAGMITIHPQEDHRRRHRLALPERAQARAEGVRQGPPADQSARRLRQFGKEASDADHSKSPRFPGQPVAGRRRGRPRRPDDRSPTRRRRRRPRSGSSRFPSICIAPLVRRRGAAARGRLHRCPLRTCRQPARSGEADRARRGGFQPDTSPAPFVSALDAGEARSRSSAGVHPGCYELFAQRARSAASAT